MLETILNIGTLVFLAMLYFLPALLAAARENPHKVPIFILNLFTGWTGLGWVAALIWTFMPPKTS
ncbi:superinfection immunity protein [Bosea massiliensis]|uniref:Superinfection immunity protein n=1 Tax=Bosea massiliensis TaxID=151419 RepID=A0ABW0P9Y4_9HYPH